MGSIAESVGSSFPVSGTNPNKTSQAGGPCVDGQGLSPRRSVDRDTCFHCREKGHWAVNCPAKSSPKPRPTSQSTVGDTGTAATSSNATCSNGSDIPDVHCLCGLSCSVCTSRTEKNPNRKFYSCPNYPGIGCCKLFKWCDEVISCYGFIKRPYPICCCGAGECRLIIQQNGQASRQVYFGCNIKKGHGACSFKQWLDHPAESYQGDSMEKDIKAIGTNILSYQIKQSASLSSETFRRESPDKETSEVQSELTVSYVGDLSQQEGQVELDRTVSTEALKEEIHDGDSCLLVETDSEDSKSQASSTLSPGIEDVEDYMSDVLSDTARYFANRFLRHLQGLSIESFLRQKNLLVEAIDRFTSFGVGDCVSFLSQLDDLIQLIDDYSVLSSLDKKSMKINRYKDKLCLIDCEDIQRQERLKAIQGKLEAIEAEDVLVCVMEEVPDSLGLANKQKCLLARGIEKAAATQSREEWTELQKKIQRVKKEQAEILATLSLGYQSKEELLEQVRTSLTGLQLCE